MKTIFRSLLLITSACLLLLTSSFSTTSAKAPEASPSEAPAIMVGTVPYPIQMFNCAKLFPKSPFPEYEETMRLVMTDSALTDEERADYLTRLEKAYTEKENAYYAALSDTKVMRHTFDCETDTSYHEITLVYTKNEILRFETTTLRAAEDVVLSYSIDSPTEATLSVFVEDPNGDSQATVTFTLLENGKLIFGSTGTSRS